MSTNDLIEDLLLRWDDLREQGQNVTAEELCREHPEVLAEVERRLRALQAMYRIPNRPPTVESTRPAAIPPPLPESRLPQIPGCEILGLLGSGGMGRVYKARQLPLNRLVAVKMILKGGTSLEEAARFRIEAEAAARLQHPNIAAIYEVGESNGCPYLLLEYVAGGNLSDRLRVRPLPPGEAAALVRTLARAVAFAHQHHIIHRDLKPSNILLAGDGTPRISDFGLAKILADDGAVPGAGAPAGLTVSGSVLGTPSYMAPEQADGRLRLIGPWTDVYGLGTILYECLTGRPPFPAESLLQTLERVRSEAPVSPRRDHPEVPVDLETICLKCLEKEPERRYASAEELAEDLHRFLEGEPIQARSPNLIDRLAWTLNRSRDLPIFPLSLHLLELLLPVPFLVLLLTFLLASGSPWYGWIALGVALGSIVSIMLVYLILSGEGVRIPLNATTRHLWSIRLGILLGLISMPILSFGLNPPGQPWDPLTVIPFWAILLGATFFGLGGLYWGRLYLYGLAFIVLALLMPLRLEWSPVALGTMVSLSLGHAVRQFRRLHQNLHHKDAG